MVVAHTTPHVFVVFLLVVVCALGSSVRSRYDPQGLSPLVISTNNTHEEEQPPKDLFQLDTLGEDVFRREQVAFQGGAFYADESLKFARDGEVIQWRVLSSTNGTLGACVFRGEGNSYSLVGMNVFSVTQGVEFTFDVPVGEQIHVRKDDLLGWKQFPGGARVFFDTKGPGHVLWSEPPLKGSPPVKIATTVHFWHGEVRTYSIQALVKSCDLEMCPHNGVVDKATCTCECPAPWAGLKCEECSRICEHGTLDEKNCACECPFPWRGDTCNECTLECKHGGQLHLDDCSCHCPAHFAGLDCGRCSDSVVCHNGGKVNPDTCLCRCPPGYHGESCTIKAEFALQLGYDASIFLPQFRDFPTRSVTVEMWVRSSHATCGTLFTYYGNFGSQFSIIHEGNLEVIAGKAHSGATGVSVDDGHWHHLAVTYSADAGVVEIFKDGCTEWKSKKFLTTKPLGDMGRLFVGSHFQGDLADVRVWNRILSEQDIKDNMDHQIRGHEQDLVLYWALDSGVGSYVEDRTEHHNNGVIWGGTEWVRERPYG